MDAWVWKGSALLGMSRQEEALVAFERALALDERNPEAWVWKGRAFSALGRKTEAEQAKRRWQKLTGQTSEQPALQKTKEAWMAEGKASYNSFRWAGALAAFERALALDERDADAWFWKSEALGALGRKTEAEQAEHRWRKLRGGA